MLYQKNASPVIRKNGIRWNGALARPAEEVIRRYDPAVIAATVFGVLFDIVQLLRTTLYSHRRLAPRTCSSANNSPCTSNAAQL